MRAVIQRVTQSSVRVMDENNPRDLASINLGLMVLLAVMKGDTELDARYIGDKIAHLRIFEDEQGKMNHSVLDKQGSILLISQFTLAADARNGRRPSFSEAAPPAEAKQLYEKTAEFLRSAGLTVAMGAFQTHMQISLINDGPVTILLDSQKQF